jgi:flap endonuclease-1
MGIKQLSKLVRDISPMGYKERPLAFYMSKKIAIDASLAIYQFLIAVRANGETLGVEEGTTSHLVGFFYRTIKYVEMGITPVYIFDGVPPEMKLQELGKRLERRKKADKEYREAVEAGDKEKMEMYDKRKTKVTPEHNAECQRLLRLMGIPFDTAPSEAEAHCAFLCRKRAVYGVATEDMDALTFGAPVLLRNFTVAKSKKLPIVEFNLAQILKDLGFDMEKFIDLCILLGCDYCSTIKGIGPKRALGMMQKHGSIEEVLGNERFDVPDEWEYKEAREIFVKLPEKSETKSYGIMWSEIDKEGIIKFLVDEKGFDRERVNKAVDKLLASKRMGTQGSLDSYFRQA